MITTLLRVSLIHLLSNFLQQIFLFSITHPKPCALVKASEAEEIHRWVHGPAWMASKETQRHISFGINSSLIYFFLQLCTSSRSYRTGVVGTLYIDVISFCSFGLYGSQQTYSSCFKRVILVNLCVLKVIYHIVYRRRGNLRAMETVTTRSMLYGTLRLNPKQIGQTRSISRAMRVNDMNSKFSVLRNAPRLLPMIVRSSGEDAADPEEEEEGDYATYVFGEDDLEDEDDPSVRLYLDCANTIEWKKWAETGMFYGFTTNPTILKRDGVHCTLPSIRQLTREAFGLDVQELQLQAWGDTMAEMYSCALDLAELDTRVVVKLPITMDGILAARRLVNDGVPITLTAVYSVHQAVTALSLGASYVAPYLGRMNDAGKDVRVILTFLSGD